MEFVDTHCHIHFPDYGADPDDVLVAAKRAGVTRLVCVGCTLEDSKAGIEFAKGRENVWVSIGLHPHEAHHYVNDHKAKEGFANLLNGSKRVVAVGECGLDYYYNHSPRESQINLLEFQLDLAAKNNLPVIFHVREAFDDFWPIFDNFRSLKGILHSFTASRSIMQEAIKRNLYIGLNGIMTFTRDEEQLAMAQAVPLENLVLETDAPFLTPKPFRGKICEPKHVAVTAEFLAGLRQVPVEKLAAASTKNAINILGLDS